MPTEISSKTRIIGVGIVLVLLAIGAWWYFASGSSYRYDFAEGETVTSWQFPGAYTGNAELEGKARDEITRLKGLLGVEGDDTTDYALYVSIANQYNLLGDGETEYAYLKKALAIDSETTGLAWYNLAVLLDRLNAPKTALDAYARAMRAQSQQLQYQSAYLEFYTEHFPEDREGIEAAFTSAQEISGDNSALLEIKARWLAETGRTDEAIAAWRKVKALSPTSATAIDAEIRRLENTR